MLLLGAFTDFWPLPSANFHSVGFRKLTICCIASKLKFYELGIKYKIMKVTVIRENSALSKLGHVHSSQLNWGMGLISCLRSIHQRAWLTYALGEASLKHKMRRREDEEKGNLVSQSLGDRQRLGLPCQPWSQKSRWPGRV